jgi:hypothetical protein
VTACDWVSCRGPTQLLDRISASSDAIHTFSVYSSVVAYLCRAGQVWHCELAAGAVMTAVIQGLGACLQVAAALRVFRTGRNVAWKPPATVCKLLLWYVSCFWGSFVVRGLSRFHNAQVLASFPTVERRRGSANSV